MSKSSIAICVLASLAISTGSAQSQVPPFEVRAVGGLDAPTRDLIELMPQIIKDQILAGIKEAKPLIDDSLAKATQGIETALRNTIDNVRCQAEGLRATTKDTVDSWFSSLNPFGSTAPTKPFDDIEKEWNSMRADISYDKKARQIAIETADYLYHLSIVECKTKVGNKVTVTTLQAEMAQRGDASGLLWLSLANRCGTADNCLVARYEDVGKILEDSDKRDIDEAGARASYDALAKPVVLSWLNRFTFSIDNYEPDLFKLQGVERSVKLAKFRRDERAQALIPGITKVLDDENDLLTQAEAPHNVAGFAGVQQLLAMLKQTKAFVVTASAQVRTDAAKASEISSVVQEDVKTALDRQDKLDARAAKIKVK
ncbi:hypothetical protein NKI79_11485 [Mesorhizobium sp. M0340]|uniref:hypothetical protein n=1 Tax=Mesorhizobium sp. M0340 TaxID=2956939 RepID=UPI003337500B